MMSFQSPRVNCCGINICYVWLRPHQVIVAGVLCWWRKPQWWKKCVCVRVCELCLCIHTDLCHASGKWEQSADVKSLSSSLKHPSLLFWKPRSFLHRLGFSQLLVCGELHSSVNRETGIKKKKGQALPFCGVKEIAVLFGVPHWPHLERSLLNLHPFLGPV